MTTKQKRRNLTTQIWPGAVKENRLTDGSFVYDVIVEGITIHAVDERSAYLLLDAIRDYAVGVSH